MGQSFGGTLGHPPEILRSQDPSTSTELVLKALQGPSEHFEKMYLGACSATRGRAACLWGSPKGALALLQATPPAAPFRFRPFWHCGCTAHDANCDPVEGVAARDDHYVGLCHCSDAVYTRADDNQRGHHYDAAYTGRETSPTAESARAWLQAESLGPLPGYRSCWTPLYWQEVRAIPLTSEWQHRPWRPTRPVFGRCIVSVKERNACRHRYSDCT